MSATRDQVAHLANVSSATVSRVFNNPTSVSPNLRESVLQAAQTLGYVPNKTAGLLRRRGTGVIAFVEVNKEERPYYWGNLRSFDWFFGRALRGVQKAIEDSTWQLRFYSVSTRKELIELSGQCDGILAYDVDTLEEATLFEDLPIPSILSHHLADYPGEHCVYTDNRLGGKLQGTYLKNLGCVSPLYITGYLDTVASHEQRIEGFLSVFPHAKVLDAKIGSENAIDVLLPQLEEVFKTHEIDCLAAVNDLTLFEILLKTNCTMPSVGYDASPFYRFFKGPVASIDIQSGVLYRTACSQLITLLNGGSVKRSAVEPELVIIHP
ncbi:LacI family DNA-binding transcriptional regulator [uncultured Sphaerochaeta sp.]|uniref:LacI family DNA-binding transcriptional regulator n=1 Tax=uncultured Sphaerochaeta sp. TaxID=886478 RepID=UPI002A0A4DA0|nr:LacI family DNA-binding transcriptional regulator [uncultured Sphaerochaeta sp.]